MRTIVESARSAIHARNLNENLWAEAVNYAVFIINQTGKSSQDDKCPADLWFGRRVDIKKLRSFGCECYVLIENHRRAKTEKKSKKGIFIGYDIDSPSYRIYIEEENDVVSSENVIFDEKLGPEKGYTELELNSEENQNSGGEETYEDETNESNHLKNKKENFDRNANDNSRKLRDRRDIRKPPNLDDYVLEYSTDYENENMALIGEIEDIAIREALKDKNWKEAMDDEFYSLTKMKNGNYGGDTGHSTSGILVLRGGPIVWYAQKQRLVATSTVEAEYRAAVSAIDDICWIRRIGKELEFLDDTKPTMICIDNRSAICMLNNHEGKINKGKKHIEIPRKFIQHHIGNTVVVKHDLEVSRSTHQVIGVGKGITFTQIWLVNSPLFALSLHHLENTTCSLHKSQTEKDHPPGSRSG
ncbi:hypothetical protein JTB14_036264 [Gonioctena quinquepunctata]|nr:hypothetical protein JTB14_036264 [Gonioctena quinquepunctata]